jgi:hypothetical protein
MELVQKDLGKYAKVDVAVEAGALKASISVPVIGLVKEAADLAKAKIPGTIDDMVIDAILAELTVLLAK